MNESELEELVTINEFFWIEQVCPRPLLLAMGWHEAHNIRDQQMLSPGWLDFTFGRFGLRDWMLNAQRYDGADGSQEQGLYLYATEHATTGQPGRRRRRPSLRVVVL